MCSVRQDVNIANTSVRLQSRRATISFGGKVTVDDVKYLPGGTNSQCFQVRDSVSDDGDTVDEQIEMLMILCTVLSLLRL
jgi:hypothetical protein